MLNDGVAKMSISTRTILLTHPKGERKGLEDELLRKGFSVIHSPLIAIEPPDDLGPLDQALDNISHYNWLIFTSAHGVESFFYRFYQNGINVETLRHLKIGAIGKATAHRLGEYGFTPDVMPQNSWAEAFLEALKASNISGRVLFPRAHKAREVLADGLREFGVEVDVVSAYQTLPAKDGKEKLEEIFKNQKPDWVVFLSSSVVHHFVAMMGEEQLTSSLTNVRIACIGPITESTLREYNLSADLVSPDTSVASLVEGLG
jgi:uroporphyrinogen III methyltransferase/synthase